jgi:hypothetical protein
MVLRPEHCVGHSKSVSENTQPDAGPPGEKKRGAAGRRPRKTHQRMSSKLNIRARSAAARQVKSERPVPRRDGGRNPREPATADRTPAARTLSRVLSIGGGRFSTGRPDADHTPATHIFSRNWRGGAGEVAPRPSAALKPGPVFDRLRGNLPTGPGGPQQWAGRVAPFCGRLKRRKGENEAHPSPKGGIFRCPGQGIQAGPAVRAWSTPLRLVVKRGSSGCQPFENAVCRAGAR